MDQYLSTVIIALITGVFSVITLVIQKKQDKVINKIDEHTAFIEKEKGLKQKLVEKEKERTAIINNMIILILDIVITFTKNYQEKNNSKLIDDNYFTESENLKKKFDKITEEIEDTTREYDIVLEMTSQLNNEKKNNDK